MDPTATLLAPLDGLRLPDGSAIDGADLRGRVNRGTPWTGHDLAALERAGLTRELVTVCDRLLYVPAPRWGWVKLAHAAWLAAAEWDRAMVKIERVRSARPELYATSKPRSAR